MHSGGFPVAPDVAPLSAETGALKIVTQTPDHAEVRVLDDDGGYPVIGRVWLTDDAWRWEHRHGEQSSPISATPLLAAGALADYHRTYKSILRVSPQSCGAGSRC